MIALLGMSGVWEWVIILVVILIFFGVGKLPAVLGQMGKGVKAFKDGMREDDDDHPKEIDVTPDTGAQRSKVSEADEVRR